MTVKRVPDLDTETLTKYLVEISRELVRRKEFSVAMKRVYTELSEKIGDE